MISNGVVTLQRGSIFVFEASSGHHYLYFVNELQTKTDQLEKYRPSIG